MRWHHEDVNNDGQMRHPRDSEAWKSFNMSHNEFASEPRNVRLGLASDGFNPFGTMSTTYSIWPVVLMAYNLPPWMCMKQSSIILSMIIPGKKQPGNDIDVYLQPLIEELNELWTEGIETYDASLSENFTLRATLMWTISDFPGLGTLSGWNVYTGLACPSCNEEGDPCRLKFSKKWCFMGHRRFLDFGHRFRLRGIHRFNGKPETRGPPKLYTGSDVLKQVQNINVIFGKKKKVKSTKKRTRTKRVKEAVQQWRKKSIFFQLPYWESNLLRHNLDVMHIEKNVCDNVIYTLLNEPKKSKDNLSARKDLRAMGIRQDLWPDENGKFVQAVYTMTNAEKDLFLNNLKNLSMPDGYGSNISACVESTNRKLTGLKSHDSHLLLEQLLPISIRSVLPDQVSAVIVELCSYFRHICSKVINPSELDDIQKRVVVCLCHMEMLFPPSFFTVMVHLIVHLVDEVKLGGPVHYRWMYPIER